MGEYNGKINVSKDTMLFVTNYVFNEDIKESTTKENILKMMPEIYENADDEEIIKMLPYKTYNDIEWLMEYLKESDDINKFINMKRMKREYPNVRYLEESMIIVMRAKYREYNYSLNPGVIEKLKRLYSKENKIIAKRYGEIENLTKGMLYTYGIVDFNFFKTQLCKYMSEIISERELRDVYFKRLNLNLFVNDYNIRWTNTNEIQEFVTYLDEEESPIDIGEIAEEQKARKMLYKHFSKQEILKREEYFLNEKAQKLYQFLKSKNIDIHKWEFEKLVKRNELGIDVLGELSNMCTFENDLEIKEFMELFNDWYNNSSQYMLGGYSPVEFKEAFENSF